MRFYTHALETAGRLVYKTEVAGWQMPACFSSKHPAQLQRPK
jgi:hypothetical protein